MGTLVDNMQTLAEDVIGSFIKRRQDLQKLDREVNNMIARYEAERTKMGVELQKKLAGFLADLEKRVQLLCKQFEEERAVVHKELMTAATVYADMEAKMDRLRDEGRSKRS
jgi:glutamine synthetase adenylyltransferase